MHQSKCLQVWTIRQLNFYRNCSQIRTDDWPLMASDSSSEETRMLPWTSSRGPGLWDSLSFSPSTSRALFKARWRSTRDGSSVPVSALERKGTRTHQCSNVQWLTEAINTFFLYSDFGVNNWFGCVQFFLISPFSPFILNYLFTHTISHDHTALKFWAVSLGLGASSLNLLH